MPDAIQAAYHADTVRNIVRANERTTDEMAASIRACMAEIACLRAANAALSAETTRLKGRADEAIRARRDIAAACVADIDRINEHHRTEAARVHDVWRRLLAEAFAERDGRQAQADALTRAMVAAAPGDPLFATLGEDLPDGTPRRAIHEVFDAAHAASMAKAGYTELNT